MAGRSRFISWLKVIVVPVILISAFSASADRLGALAETAFLGLAAGGLVLSLLASGLVAWRMGLVLPMTVGKVPVSFRTLWVVNLQAGLYSFMPVSAGDIGCDLVKLAKLNAVLPAAGYTRLTAAVLIDRLVGAAAAATIFVVATPLLMPQLLTGLTIVAPSLVVAAALGFAILTLCAIAYRFRSQAVVAIRFVWGHLGRVAMTWLVSLTAHALMSVPIWLVAREMDTALAWPIILFITAATLVGSAFPLGMLGVGLGDLAGGGLYMAFGSSPAVAVLLVTYAYLLRLGNSVTGGLLELIGAVRAPPQAVSAEREVRS